MCPYYLLEMVFHGVVHEAVQIARITPGDAGSADDIFKNQIPANHKSCQFSHCHIAEEII